MVTRESDATMPEQDQLTEPGWHAKIGPVPAAAPRLRIPAVAATSVDRPRLLAVLDDERGCAGPRPVTTVIGPAGAGKTTLLATWAVQQGNASRVAWVTLDAGDNDPARLWRAVREALLPSGNGSAGAPSPADSASYGSLSALLAAVSAARASVCLVLDEADHLRDPDALRDLEVLVRQTPDNLRLILAARSKPRLHLSRLRLEGRLLEIGMPELAFTRTEAESLFAHHRLPLAPDELDLVVGRTEGWPAGLRLAAMSLADDDTRPAKLAAFPAEDPAVVDYLTEEVLGSYSHDVHLFLRVTSICDVVSADLAAALTGRVDSGEILDSLDRGNALVDRTNEPGGWYRYHPVLRSVMRAELERRQLGAPRELHRTAAEWFRDFGRPLDALQHAVAAGHRDLIDELVRVHGLQEILSGRAEPLHRLLSDLPAGIPARPFTSLVAAAAALDVCDVPAADRYMSTVDGTIEPADPGQVRTLSANVTMHRARLDGQAARPPDALESATDTSGDPDLDTLTLLNKGTAILGLGDNGQAEQLLRQALRLATEGHRDHAVLLCLIQLAAVCGARGELSRMDEQAAGAIQYATERGWSRNPHCAPAYTMRSAQAYLRLDHYQAKKFSALAKEVLPPGVQPPAALAALTLDAIIALDGAEIAHAAADTVRDRWRRLGSSQVAPQLIAYMAPTAQRIALRAGWQDWAADVVEQVETRLGSSAEQALLLAELQASRAKLGQARNLLAPALSGDAPPVAVTTSIDAWLLEASLLGRTDDWHRAHGAVTKALSLAEPISALRPFRDAGPAVRDLLVKGIGRFGKLDRFVSTTLATLPASPAAPVDRLTSRELDLLVELPSMRTTEEIAESLFVSVNTVKTHLRGIYRKLGVSHRRDAVVVARERGLL
jgi:LuxR family maltose regulon positive regulatory protein